MLMSRVKRLLRLGAHCDDIEIGAGGTIMRLAEAYPQAEVFLAGTGARDGFLPFQGELVKEVFEDLKSHDLGRPNFYVPLSEETCPDKIAGLLEAFPSRATPLLRGILPFA
jgi:hypothetical protein